MFRRNNSSTRYRQFPRFSHSFGENPKKRFPIKFSHTYPSHKWYLAIGVAFLSAANTFAPIAVTFSRNNFTLFFLRQRVDRFQNPQSCHRLAWNLSSSRSHYAFIALWEFTRDDTSIKFFCFSLSSSSSTSFINPSRLNFQALWQSLQLRVSRISVRILRGYYPRHLGYTAGLFPTLHFYFTSTKTLI